MKTRGLKEAKEKLGDIEKIIDRMIRQKGKIKILESGCGYGRLMMDLTKKYGNKIEIIGMNLKKEHGDKKKMISLALKNGILKKQELTKVKIPRIIYGDAGEKLPFKDKSIDLILSQVSTYLYKDKLHFLEEVARVLDKKGLARTTLCLKMEEYPDEFKEILKIYNKGWKISAEKFILNSKKVKIKKSAKGRRFFEVKSGKLNFKSKLEATINYNHLNKRWFGVQSIYAIK